MSPHDNSTPPTLDRRSFLGSMLLLAGAGIVGCTPARAILGLYDGRFDTDDGLVDRTLRAFVVTIIPGAPIDDPHLTRAFSDPALPFARHRALFAADLARRSRDHRAPFDELDEHRRALVVRDGLGADDITASLYRGAILIAQVSFYGSIYDDARGCSLIDFPGANGGFSPEEVSYANTAAMLAVAMTADGNFS